MAATWPVKGCITREHVSELYRAIDARIRLPGLTKYGLCAAMRTPEGGGIRQWTITADASSQLTWESLVPSLWPRAWERDPGEPRGTWQLWGQLKRAFTWLCPYFSPNPSEWVMQSTWESAADYTKLCVPRKKQPVYYKWQQNAVNFCVSGAFGTCGGAQSPSPPGIYDTWVPSRGYPRRPLGEEVFWKGGDPRWYHAVTGLDNDGPSSVWPQNLYTFDPDLGNWRTFDWPADMVAGGTRPVRRSPTGVSIARVMPGIRTTLDVNGMKAALDKLIYPFKFTGGIDWIDDLNYYFTPPTKCYLSQGWINATAYDFDPF